MRERRARSLQRAAAAALAWAPLLALGALVARALRTLPTDEDAGLADAALDSLALSGLEHPVTAVLMSYRAYDTLLEIAVLFLAMLGVWSLARAPSLPAAPPGLVLQFLNQLLVPFLLLFAGFLLWAGSRAPGGAFQAGAVLAAAGVLVTLSGTATPRVPHALHRVLLLLGLGAFLVTGVVTAAAGGGFLALRAPAAKAVILAIEAAASLSIGLGLLAIFRGGRPRAGAGGEAP